MFDIGFWEMILIGLVSLLVFGPERLPRVVREVSLWVRKARALVQSVKAEVDQELQLQEIRQTLLEKKRSFEDAALALKEVEHGSQPDSSGISRKRGAVGDSEHAGE